MSLARQISTLRKAGQLDEALAAATPVWGEPPTNTELTWALGWLLYALVKRDVAEFEAKRITPNTLVEHLDEWLRQYTRGGKPTAPDLLHSLLMTQVLKVAREWPNFLAFAHWWWNPALLRQEDREPFETNDGKTIASLEVRFVYAVARALNSDRVGRRSDLDAWGASLLDKTLHSHPNDQWLHYFKSKLLIAQGATSEAREHLLPVVRRQRHASWAWSQFGQAWETDDAEKAILCYFRALQVARNDKEVLTTREQLADVLAKAERYAEAAAQVRAAKQYRDQQGYKIPQKLAQFVNSDWFQRYSEQSKVTKEPDVSTEAEALIFGADASDVVHQLGVIDNQNIEKALAHVAFSADDGVVLLYRTMKDVSNLAVGTCVEVGFIKGSKRPISVRQSEQTTIPGVYESFEGELSQQPGQAFAFLITDAGARVFVHPGLAATLGGAVGNRVLSRAVMSRDRKGRAGWRALHVEPL